MQNIGKTTSINKDDAGIKQKKIFTFPPQDGMETPYQCEADTIEEAEGKFKDKVKSKE